MMLLGSGLAVVGGWWWWQRRDRREAVKATAARAQRITDPQRQGRAMGRVWQLQSSGCQCEHARRLGGRRLDIDDTVPLFSDRANHHTCTCYYRPLSEARRGVRRDGSDRRAGLRFDLRAPERRLHGERRRCAQQWQQEHLLR